MIVPYLGSCIVCGFVLSWWDTPPQYCERSIWDRVGLYTIHTFLNLLVERQFDSFLKHIIPFWYHIMLLLFKLYQSYLLLLSSSTLLSLCTVPRLVKGLSAQPHRNAHLSLRRWPILLLQWCCPRYCPHHQVRHGIEIRTCGPLHHRSRNDSTLTNAHQHGLVQTQKSYQNG